MGGVWVVADGLLNLICENAINENTKSEINIRVTGCTCPFLKGV